ncbi:MAG: NAD(P)-dependent oxidoreductase [Bryobacterales bacterium]|nr:NAD(P)-dependent oxidoreductase [Bryobacterales bacterium]
MPGDGLDSARLERELSVPAEEDLALMRRLEGGILILGVAGKMGPTLALLARRAADLAGVPRRIVGVARFSSPEIRHRLESWGIDTIRADLLHRDEVEALPSMRNVIFMAGQKFGTSGAPSATWAANAYMPALVAERFARSRIVAFSSGNVYPFSDATGRGPSETDPPAPVGEYAQSVLGRERLLEHFSRANGTPVAIMRLNYAVEPRYGVLRDIADRVLAGRAVDLRMGHVNVIWQRDANSVALRLLERCSSPPFVLNVTGPRRLSVRALAESFGKAFGVEPVLAGTETPTALLSDASLCRSLFGPPRVHPDAMVERVAEWVLQGGASLGKPTHFEEREGEF